MTTKLDVPKNKGELTYTNTGSCSRLVNYQISNKEKLGDDNSFFTLERDSITAQEAKDLIDFNVKGLKKEDEKFYSFSLNPSDDELKHINNDKKKIKTYVREVMNNYATNFKDKGLNNKDLVWTAIIHDTRYYTHEDIKKANDLKEPVNFRVGDKKKGNNLHVHVIVSRQDATMTKTLTIRGRKGKENFSLFEFQKKNQDKFQTLNNYKIGVNIYGETQTKAILNSLFKIEHKMPLSEKEILKIAERHNFSGKINYNIKDLEKSINRGEVINDPYKFIEVGKKEYKNELKEAAALNTNVSESISNLLEVVSSGPSTERNRGEVPDINEYIKRRKKKKKINFN